jgi:hypothetical protein
MSFNKIKLIYSSKSYQQEDLNTLEKVLRESLAQEKINVEIKVELSDSDKLLYITPILVFSNTKDKSYSYPKLQVSAEEIPELVKSVFSNKLDIKTLRQTLNKNDELYTLNTLSVSKNDESNLCSQKTDNYEMEIDDKDKASSATTNVVRCLKLALQNLNEIEEEKDEEVVNVDNVLETYFGIVSI